MSATETISLGSPSPAPTGDTSYPIQLTSRAVGAVKLAIEEEGLEDGTGLRVAVVGGGCSGYSYACLLYTSPSPRDQRGSRMPSSA